jgi:hypothetical protein
VNFLYSQRGNAIEAEEIVRHEGDKTKHNDTAVSYSKESVPKVLRTIEGP